MSAILLDGGIVHYEVIGRGRPIIFLHGWVGSWRYWVPAMQTASTNFRAYAVDMWGFGDTARDSSHYALEQQSALLDHFLRELGIGKIALVGHGLGALAGLLFAMRNPNVVDRIMAVQMPLDASAVPSRLRNNSLVDLVDWLVAKTPAAEAARTDAIKADQLALSTSFNASDTWNFASRLSSFNTACLLVYGQSDPAIPVPIVDPATLHPMVHILPLEQTGHFPMLDDAARFNRLLTDFLSLESGETPRDLQLKEEWKRRVR
jgi:pimeloyl-ACP methyl ester carboxylesterase